MRGFKHMFDDKRQNGATGWLGRALLGLAEMPGGGVSAPPISPFDYERTPMVTPPGANPLIMDYYRQMDRMRGQMTPQQMEQAERDFYQRLMTR